MSLQGLVDQRGTWAHGPKEGPHPTHVHGFPSIWTDLNFGETLVAWGISLGQWGDKGFSNLNLESFVG